MNKKELFFIVLVGFLLFATRMAARAEWFSGNVSQEKIYSIDGGTLGPRISVAVSSTLSEENPAVAFCNGIYLVVYQRDGDIYGQRLDLEGMLLGDAIKINVDSATPGITGNPDVACIWPEPILSDKYFIVVYTYVDEAGQNYNVHAQALTTEGVVKGNPALVAASNENEFDPTIACEVDDYYCLVLYELGNNDIQGQRLHLSVGFDTHIENLGDKFDPDPGVEINRSPDLIWSMTRQEYMAVWEDWFDDPVTDHWRSEFVFIYENEQGPGAAETKSAPGWLIPYSNYGSGWEHHQETPKVAFNNLSGYYMVTYRNFYAATSGGVGVLYIGATMVGNPFNLDGDNNWATYPAVAFSGGATGSANADDEFLAVNLETPSDYSNLEAAYINGDELSDRDVPIEAVTGSVVLSDPDVSGNAVDGKYLVVWEAQNPGGQSDIFAQRMGNYQNPPAVFIPVALR
jgi:hypothetical protein